MNTFRSLAVTVSLVAAWWVGGGVAFATVPPDENDFLPVDRGLGECISAVPKPGCGSEARGGPLQFALFIILVLAVGFIMWRIRRGVRRVQSSS